MNTEGSLRCPRGGPGEDLRGGGEFVGILRGLGGDPREAAFDGPAFDGDSLRNCAFAHGVLDQRMMWVLHVMNAILRYGYSGILYIALYAFSGGGVGSWAAWLSGAGWSRGASC